VTPRVLSNPGKAYAIYLDGNGPTNLILELPPGEYSSEWLNPKSGSVEQLESFIHKGGERILTSPVFQDGIALRLRHTTSSNVR
jgi:hypothetical protein